MIADSVEHNMNFYLESQSEFSGTLGQDVEIVVKGGSRGRARAHFGGCGRAVVAAAGR
jgi:hypothetical protein